MLLFCPVILEKDYTINGLVDTGATASIISSKVSKKIGSALIMNPQKIQCYNKSIVETKGHIEANITIGKTTLKHKFIVCDDSAYPLLLGNDILKILKGKPNPSAHTLELPRQTAIQCLAVEASKTITENESSLQIKAIEKLNVEPVQQDNVIYFPLGKSMILPAKQTKTIILPYKCNKTIQITDSNRLPNGIFSSSTVWAKGKPLKITICNFTNQTIQIGSKTAVAAGITEWSNITLKKIDDTIKCLRRN